MVDRQRSDFTQVFEGTFDIGVAQVIETGAKRSKRVAVARLALQRTRAEGNPEGSFTSRSSSTRHPGTGRYSVNSSNVMWRVSRSLASR